MEQLCNFNSTHLGIDKTEKISQQLNLHFERKARQRGLENVLLFRKILHRLVFAKAVNFQP
jgi:hypothetical protein